MRPRQLFVVPLLEVGFSCLAVAACGHGSALPRAGGVSTRDADVRVRARRQTTQRYADYAPSPHEHALIERAFGQGSDLGANLSNTESTSQH